MAGGGGLPNLPQFNVGQYAPLPRKKTLIAASGTSSSSPSSASGPKGDGKDVVVKVKGGTSKSNAPEISKSTSNPEIGNSVDNVISENKVKRKSTLLSLNSSSGTETILGG